VKLQPGLFGLQGKSKQYRPILTVEENAKGVLDIDTVKGCAAGLRAYPDGGCYGECYALKSVKRYGVEFSKSVSRKITARNWPDIFRRVSEHPATWYRIGTAGDPCHDWDNTLDVCDAFRVCGE